MKNFDQFEKLVNINESEVSVNINEARYLDKEDNANKLIKQFEKPTNPVMPFKRDFTAEETKAMHQHFPMYSWSKIDAEGKIVLGGGEEARGSVYITEEDLKKLMN